ncbi:MAG: DMT family transporter [Ignavibacteria bacterium]|jgi:drug/metabolite transporter (DMT)-like permease|nr:DMT family transporter [Ignavibacteria bacterium]
MKKFLTVIFLIFTASFTPIAAKFTVAEISPLSLAFLRFGTAAVLFNILFHFKKLNYRIDKEDRLMFLILGALVIPINQFFFLNGVYMSFASHSGVTYACTPLFAYVIQIFLKHEHFSVKKLIPILMTITGIFFVFYDGIVKSVSTDSNVVLGDIFLFFAVLSWALYITLSKNMVTKYGALKTSTIAFTAGIILYIPVFIYDIPNLNFDNLSVTGILGFIHLTFIVAFAGYFVFTYSSKYINVTELTTSTNLSPIVTIIFSWLLLNEKLSYFFITGSVITIMGVFISQLKISKDSLNTLTNEY